MVLAMMPLLALRQVRHAMRSSVARRRLLAAGLLLAGYALVWMAAGLVMVPLAALLHAAAHPALILADRKSTRLNSSHLVISYAVFCLKKKQQRCSIVRSRS